MRGRFGLDVEEVGKASGLAVTGTSAAKVLAVAAPAPVMASPSLAPASSVETVAVAAMVSDGTPGSPARVATTTGGVNNASGAGKSELLPDYHWDAADNRYEFTGNQDIDAILFGSRWTVGVISYSFPTSGSFYNTPYDVPGYLTNHVVFNAAQQTMARYALTTLVQSYITPIIVEVTETATEHAIVRLSQTGDASLTSAHGNFPGSDASDGDVWLGMTGEPFYLTPQIGNWGGAIIMHEIGHALGLKHGHSDLTTSDLTLTGELDGPGPRFGTRPLPTAHDTWAYSVMTYRSAPGYEVNFQGDEYNQPQTYMMNDIAALQYMYGAYYGVNATDTVYTFNSYSGQMSINGVAQEMPTLDAVDRGKIFRTIWDGGGIDTYDFSNFTGNQTIRLTAGDWSTMNVAQLSDMRPLDAAANPMAPGNVANALMYQGNTASLIENAKGGSGNDTIHGNQLGNTIYGGAGYDQIAGYNGNDLQFGEAGDDYLDGLLGDDTLSGGDGNDYMLGYDGNDSLTGGVGNDAINGEAGNDYITGGSGNDTMYGGSGNDTYYVHDAGDVIMEYGAEGIDWVYSVVTYTLGANLENLVLAASIAIDGTGNAGNNQITGNAYNNVIFTGGGNDTVDAGAGNDTLYSSGAGSYTAGLGDDVVFAGNGGAETLDGGAGTDWLNTTSYGGNYAVNLTTGLTNLFWQSFVGFEALTSGAGNDSLTGSNAANTIDGGAGNDSITGEGGHDSVRGGLGNDTITGGTGNDTLVGDAGADSVNGQDGHDLITSSGQGGIYDGGTGNDTLFAGGGNETLYGGSGTDLLDTTSWSGDATVNLTTGLTQFAAQLLSGFENLTSGAGNDSLTGTAGVNVINGGAGNDTINGGSGNDTLDGGDGIDTYDVRSATGGATAIVIDLHVGTWTYSAQVEVAANFENLLAGASNEVIRGTYGANWIDAGGGNDTIDSGSGDDTVDGGAGNDSFSSIGGGIKVYNGGDGQDTIAGSFSYGSALDGGSGVDLLDVSFILSSPAPVFNMSTGVWADGVSSFTAVNFENYIGSVVGESVSGTSAVNRIEGGDGNDTIDGGAGYDTLDGGAGIDTYDIRSNLSNAVIDLAAGTYTDSGGTEIVVNFENVLGGDGHQTYFGTADANRIDGGDGNDTINGGAGNDTILGGNGDDYIHAFWGNAESIDGGTGNDTLNTSLWSGDYAVNLTTGVTNWAGESFLNLENIISGIGNDTLIGTSGANWIDAGVGSDVMNGGAGDDTYVVDYAGDVVVETNGNGNDLVMTSVTWSLTGIVVERLTMTGAGNINSAGNGLANTLTGNIGNNVLDGAVGNDTMIGGLGNDSYYVNATGDVVTELAGEGTDTVFAAVTYSLAGKQIENLSLTGAVAIDGIGNGFGNILTGNSAVNTLDGGGGHDKLDGGAGADNLIGGTGNDTYLVDNAADAITELAGGGADLVESSVTYTLSANVEQLTLTGTAVIDGTGNDLNNVLTGNSGVNVLAGGLGNDTYYVQNATDNVVEAGGAGMDVIFSTVTYSLNGRYAETITLTGAANINATGNSLANTLNGNDGNNTINGKGGADKLSGGLGADLFLFEVGSGADKILDLSQAQGDHINVNAYTAGVVNNALVTQSGSDVLINLGGGNIITVINALEANVEAQMVW
ncbi:hypothetical protein ABAC460_14195 [Asticcacaulis sp. AC460]|uniref:M10 family metallopeptidase C-terminal domain-containing protein n=1 Tax=Asticcacaulis sp. AC460 TaxID=1282360 RepID=UPI0003C3DEE2|nr:M10 family metallopeptidase C-terminal domain-containing protein [Asticcacaulis sp. AC460]ESQ88928.1 hypothetical protein ABAC460_14195 [Asticcacaulis sp. AC460]